MKQAQLKAERWLVMGDRLRQDSLHEQASLAYRSAAKAYAACGDLKQAERCVRAAAAEMDRWADALNKLREERELRKMVS